MQNGKADFQDKNGWRDLGRVSISGSFSRCVPINSGSMPWQLEKRPFPSDNGHMSDPRQQPNILSHFEDRHLH
jgi:hypothetical protein